MNRRVLLAVGIALPLAFPIACATPRPGSPGEDGPGGPRTEADATGPAPGEAPKRASSSPEDDRPAVRIHLDEGTIRFAKDGSTEQVFTLRYTILERSAVGAWGAITASWAPWYEARPEVEAKVTLADGQTFTLDPATIEESSERGGGQTYTDRRRLRAPLPQVDVGATVERVVRYSTHRPFFVGGEVVGYGLGGRQPVEVARVTVEAPAELPLKYQVRNVELAPLEDETKDGVRRLVFEQKNREPNDGFEYAVPPEAMLSPQVQFSVAGDWKGIASAYAKVVDDTIASADTSALAVEKGGDRVATAQRIADKLHERVRYTGIEFGENAIVPAAPAKVFERGYGDCKDKAALLVAALRAHDIPAHVALIRGGSLLPISDMPGLNQFDHAIVYAPGDPALWIDATATNVAVTEIPLMLQGRRALIARSGEQGLTTTPSFGAERNVYREVRAVKMADFGRGAIVEKSTGTGGMNTWLRDRFAEAADHEIHQSLENYAKENYDGTLSKSIARKGAKSVGDTFELGLTIDEAGVAVTSDLDAAVNLDIRTLFEWLPPALTSLPEPGEPLEPRKSPLYNLQPYVAEIEYRVTPPGGFVHRPFPDDETVQLGLAKVDARYRMEGRDIVASFRFDSGPRRWSPKDVDAFKATYRELIIRSQIAMDHEGARLRGEGKMRQALEAYQRIVTAEPKNGVQHARYAMALLNAGLGDAARAAAKRGVQASPKAWFPRFVQGLTESADFFGRQNMAPHDRKAALAAYEQAKELDPKRLVARQNLAVLLEQDERGARYAPGADLEAAIQEYRAIKEELQDRSLDVNLAIALMHTGALDEAIEVARGAPLTAERHGILAAAITLAQNAQAALDALRADSVAARDIQAALELAQKKLLSMRHYDKAADLAELAAGGTDPLKGQAFAATMRKLKRHEGAIEKMKEPTATMLRFAKAGAFGASEAELRAFVSKEAIAEEERRQELAGKSGPKSLSRTLSVARRLTRGGVTAVDMALDMLVSLPEFYVDGDDATGYRLRTVIPGSGPNVAYLVKEGGRYRVRAAREQINALGAEAFARLGRGDTKAATVWLDWALDELQGASEGHVLGSFWSRVDERDAKRARNAALILMALDGGTARAAVDHLKRVPDGLTEEAQSRWLVAASRANALLHRHDSALTFARRAVELTPEDKGAVSNLYYVLREADRGDELRGLLEARLARDPTDPIANEAMYTCLASMLGDFEAAERHLDSRMARGERTPSLLNNRAWNALFMDGDAARMEEDALAAATERKVPSSGSLHTLATVYVETDQSHKGIQVLQSIYDMKGQTLDPHDWYIYGRAAEAYGRLEEAKEAYRRVERPKSAFHGSTWELAQKRLKKL